MIPAINNPGWLSRENISPNQHENLKRRLKEVVSENPLVTVCVVAYNEEKNIANCLYSLSMSVAKVPFEIIVVNNNSTDTTQAILDQLEVTSYFQPVQGCGAARETGQQNARGKYVLMADADCMYPPGWIQIMYESLTMPGVVAVYGRHSFLGDKNVPRWKYAFYEVGKDLVVEFRNFKRPYLNAYGMSFGYLKELGLKEGYVSRNIRGEDGRLCYDLMKYGQVRLVRSGRARVWTAERNFATDGGLSAAVTKRILRELTRLGDYFKPPAPHDTKISENSELKQEEYKEIIKDKLRMK